MQNVKSVQREGCTKVQRGGVTGLKKSYNKKLHKKNEKRKKSSWQKNGVEGSRRTIAGCIKSKRGSTTSHQKSENHPLGEKNKKAKKCQGKPARGTGQTPSRTPLSIVGPCDVQEEKNKN